MVAYWAAVTWFLQQWFSRTSSFLFASFFKMKIIFFIKNPTNTKFKKYFAKNHLNIFLAKIIVVNIPLDIFSVLVFIYIIFLKKKKYSHDFQPVKVEESWRDSCEESMLERRDGLLTQSHVGIFLEGNMVPLLKHDSYKGKSNFWGKTERNQWLVISPTFSTSPLENPCYDVIS